MIAVLVVCFRVLGEESASNADFQNLSREFVPEIQPAVEALLANLKLFEAFLNLVGKKGYFSENNDI